MADVVELIVFVLSAAFFSAIAGFVALKYARGSPEGTGREELAAAQARLSEARENFERQKQEFDARVETTFAALSAAALKSNSEQFSQHAATVLKPVQDKLIEFDAFVKAIEKDRKEAYGSLTTAVNSLKDSQKQLQAETTTLSSALRNPQVRGRWGEVGLERCFELAEMTKGVHYETQVSGNGEDGKGQRPDAVVRLPNGRSVVIDAKVPLAAYLKSLDVATPGERELILKEHAQAVRTHVTQLSGKEYYKREKETAEFVVLFLRGEVFFSAALAADPDLLEYAASKGVILATPTTLISLLSTVERGWRQERIAKNAEDIAVMGRKVHDSLAVFAKHFNAVGSAIDKAADCYNDAAGSFQENLSKAARKLEEHGAGSAKEIPEQAIVEKTSRRVPVAGPAKAVTDE